MHKLYPAPKPYLLELVSQHLKPVNYDCCGLSWKQQLETLSAAGEKDHEKNRNSRYRSN